MASRLSLRSAHPRFAGLSTVIRFGRQKQVENRKNSSREVTQSAAETNERDTVNSNKRE